MSGYGKPESTAAVEHLRGADIVIGHDGSRLWQGKQPGFEALRLLGCGEGNRELGGAIERADLDLAAPGLRDKTFLAQIGPRKPPVGGDETIGIECAERIEVLGAEDADTDFVHADENEISPSFRESRIGCAHDNHRNVEVDEGLGHLIRHADFTRQDAAVASGFE